MAGKTIRIDHVPGPVGVRWRDFSNARIEFLGWQSRVFLREGIAKRCPGYRCRSERTGLRDLALVEAPTSVARPGSLLVRTGASLASVGAENAMIDAWPQASPVS